MDSLLRDIDELANRDAEIRSDDLRRLLEDLPEDHSLSLTDWHKVVQFCADQLGRWQVKWLFSDAKSPDENAATELKAWAELWEQCAGALIERVSGVRDELYRHRDLSVLHRALEKRERELRSRVVAGRAVSALSHLALVCHRLGAKEWAVSCIGLRCTRPAQWAEPSKPREAYEQRSLPKSCPPGVKFGMAGNAELRHELQRITDEYTGLIVQLQVPSTESLRERWRHNIRLVEAAVVGDPHTYNFNCHAFTFSLYEANEFWELRLAKPQLIPTGQFVLERLVPAMRPLRRNESKSGDIALYFDGARITHSGVISGRAIESKWGTAHRWRHGVFEVPWSYGTRVRYFRRPAAQDVLATYLAFAKVA